MLVRLVNPVRSRLVKESEHLQNQSPMWVRLVILERSSRDKDEFSQNPSPMDVMLHIPETSRLVRDVQDRQDLSPMILSIDIPERSRLVRLRFP